jgi:CRP-like cAMP-binding protein
MILANYSILTLSEKLSKIPFLKNTSPSNLFKNIDFFKEVGEADLGELSADILISEFAEGDVISRRGKFDERLYVILSGTARAVLPTEYNPKFELYRLGEGDFFGEGVIFKSEPRMSSIIANDNIVAFSIDEKTLKKLMSVSGYIKTLIDKKYIDRKLESDLRRVPVFTGLPDNYFKDVLAKVELISVDENRVMFAEGDTGDAFYLIREGEADVYHVTGGEKKLIAILKDGQYFGEMSLLLNESRNATVEVKKNTSLVKLSTEAFHDIIKKDKKAMDELHAVALERKKRRDDILRDPSIARKTRMLLDLNKEINNHLDIISQCTIETDKGSALLASLPGSRYPYVYPRDCASASRLLYKLGKSPIKAGGLAFTLLQEIARFIVACQRDDGYWGQRYGINCEDKGIYRQEDNVAHGVTILSRYLLAALDRNVNIPDIGRIIEAITKGANYSVKHYYRNEIHLFYSTTSIHESAIEEGYSIWVNYAYLLMFKLLEKVADKFNAAENFKTVFAFKDGFESTARKVFNITGRYVRRLKPNGEIDLRPDITLMSPFIFGTGVETDIYEKNDAFNNSIDYIVQTLWDADLGMLQRYLPFIEDPDTHIHAGNGPWLQYTLMLAQYYFHSGDMEKGNEILAIVDRFKSREGYLCEHLTTSERFEEFKKFEWLTGADFSKEFSPKILVPGLPYDLIVEELNNMNKTYETINRKVQSGAKSLTFAIPLMWSHAEYAMALMIKSDLELKNIQAPRSGKK